MQPVIESLVVTISHVGLDCQRRFVWTSEEMYLQILSLSTSQHVYVFLNNPDAT